MASVSARTCAAAESIVFYLFLLFFSSSNSASPRLDLLLSLWLLVVAAVGSDALAV